MSPRPRPRATLSVRSTPALQQIKVPDQTRARRPVSRLKDVHELGVLFVGLILPLLKEIIWTYDCFVLGELFSLAFVEVHHVLRMVNHRLHVTIYPLSGCDVKTHETVDQEQDQGERPADHHRGHTCGIFRGIRRLESLRGNLFVASVIGHPLSPIATRY